MQSKKALGVVVAIAASVLLWGCGKDANKPASVVLSPLERGINNYLASRDQCITVAEKWPAKAAAGTSAYARLDSFVDAGLLKVDVAGGSATFEPTADGAASFVTKDGAQKLCLPAATVVKVSKETPIKESGKDGVTEVAFTYSVKDAPAWAKNEKVKKAFAAIAEKADGQVLAETQFFHETSNGWEVVRGGNAEFFGETIKPMRPL